MGAACFFFNDTATTEIYTLSLHDALPIYTSELQSQAEDGIRHLIVTGVQTCDRKSTRLNSSHDQISYAVFCLKKKKKTPERLLQSDALCRLLLQSDKYAQCLSIQYYVPMPRRTTTPTRPHSLCAR